MQKKMTSHLIQRLEENKLSLQEAFKAQHPVSVARHFVVDDLLPAEWAHSIYEAFPKRRQMNTLKHWGECSLRCIAAKNASDTIKDINAAIQDPKVVALIEAITGIQALLPDPSSLAGGISSLYKGHFINPHLDNSHDLDNRCYRSLNVLYYVSPNWQLDSGGHYEIWDNTVSQRVLVPSFFNRLVVMETTPTSWHSVSKVQSETPRCCVFNYYFSEHSPTGQDYFHKTAFMGRPEQPLHRTWHKAKRLWR